MSERPPDYEDLLAREIVQRAADEAPPSPASGAAPLVFGAAGWVIAGFLLLGLLALGGCAVLLS